jgi:hypothetical protein
MATVATAVWRISPRLVLALDERLGAPLDSYLNGSQTWLVAPDGEPDGGARGGAGDDAEAPHIGAGGDDETLELRLHPVAGYTVPRGMSHYDVWEQVVDALAAGADGERLALGSEVRSLRELWDGLECFAAYGAELEPQAIATVGTRLVGIAPDAAGLVDHDAVADAWERARGRVSIVDLLFAQLSA